MQISDGYFGGVDVGGTKVAAGLVNSAGEITHRTQVPMVVADAAAGLASVTSAIDSVREATNPNPELRGLVSGIGICAPGPLDPRTGVAINPPNLPGWRNFPLGDLISKAYGLPVRVDNDGNAAALAENAYTYGFDIFFGCMDPDIDYSAKVLGQIARSITLARGDPGAVRSLSAVRGAPSISGECLGGAS